MRKKHYISVTGPWRDYYTFLLTTMYEFHKFCLQNFVQISLYLPRDKNFKKVSMSAKLPKSNTGNFFKFRTSRFSCTKFGKRHDISLLEISQLFCTAKFLASDLLYLFVLSQHKLTNTSYTYLRLTELWKKSTLIISLLYKEMCVLSTLWSFENRNCSITIF